MFVIRRDLEQDFRAAVGRRLEGRMDVAYVFQELAGLPPPHAPAPGRVKPWGTGHAVLAAEETVRRPFAVINADDFYGASAYRALAKHFRGGKTTPGQPGVRARGLSAPADAFRARDREPRHLPDGCGRPADRIDEVMKIERTADGRARHPAAAGGWQPLTGDEIVSMTCFGFTPAFFGQLRGLFAGFLKSQGRSETAEFYLPVAVNDLLQAGRAEVRLLQIH